MTVAPLDATQYRDLVRRALAEDVGAGDITSNAVIPAALRSGGRIVANEDCVLAGLDVAVEVFRQVDAAVRVTPRRVDGDRCQPADVVAELSGYGRALLTAERTALNFLQRLSGIATLTRAFVEVSRGAIELLDTRKTTPTLRALEKYAVRVGGGANHRLGLDAGVLIKDNHIALAGGVGPAVARMRAAAPEATVEVEVESLEQVDAGLTAGAHVLLVDNMTDDEVVEVVRRARGRAAVEISGGVTLDRMATLAVTGADRVSVGALTHSAPSANFSLELEPATP